MEEALTSRLLTYTSLDHIASGTCSQRPLFLIASCPALASATIGGDTFDQDVMGLSVVIAKAREDVQIIYDQAGSSSANVADYGPGKESPAMRARGRIGTARPGKGVDWTNRESVRQSNWFIGYQERIKGGIEISLQDGSFDEVVVLCIKGGVITQLEQDTVNEIIRDVESDLKLKSSTMIKPISCLVLDYARFVEMCDPAGTHRQALLDTAPAEQCAQAAISHAGVGSPAKDLTDASGPDHAIVRTASSVVRTNVTP